MQRDAGRRTILVTLALAALAAAALSLISTSQSYAARLVEGLPANWWRIFRAAL